MIPGIRAKITDFGMSKLASVNPRMSALTLCPGNILYMSPEALDKGNPYTSMLDIFSFGVIVIQILTRMFPNPTDRFRSVPTKMNREDEENDEEVDEGREIRQVVPEAERRKSHLDLIPDTHSLKPLAIHCLKNKERRRPSALQLCEKLSEMKQSSQFTDSMQEVQSSDNIQQLKLQLRGQRILTDAKTRESRNYQTQISQLHSTIEDKDSQLQVNQIELLDKEKQLKEQQYAIEARDRQLQVRDEQIQEMHHKQTTRIQENERKDKLLEQTRQQLEASEQLVAEFQQSLQQKDDVIFDLQRTVSAQQRMLEEIQGLVSRQQPENMTMSPAVTMTNATIARPPKDLSNVRWRESECTRRHV